MCSQWRRPSGCSAETVHDGTLLGEVVVVMEGLEEES